MSESSENSKMSSVLNHDDLNHYDLIIVGGGLVGNTLALALASHHFKIAILDKSSAFKQNNKNDNEKSSNNARALALSHPSIQCLKTLRLWQKIEGFSEPINEVHISMKGHFGETRLRAMDEGLTELGRVISADILEEALRAQVLNSYPNITIFNEAQIEALNPIVVKSNDDFNALSINSFVNWQIKFSSKNDPSVIDKELYSKLLVAADGTDSFVRNKLGIDVTNHDPKQVAIVTNLELSKPHQGIAYERFTSLGSIAMLPMQKNQVKCVWVVNEAVLQSMQLKEMIDTEFLQILQTTFGNRLGKFLKMGQRMCHRLTSVYADTCYQPRLVLIGNAANTLHPIAAQGFNLGLRDAATLAELLMEAKQNNQEFGDIELLKKYNAKRVADHHLTREFTESLSMNFALSLGIKLTSFIPFYKKWINQLGLGFKTKLPRYCRGLNTVNSE